MKWSPRAPSVCTRSPKAQIPPRLSIPMHLDKSSAFCTSVRWVTALGRVYWGTSAVIHHRMRAYCEASSRASMQALARLAVSLLPLQARVTYAKTSIAKGNPLGKSEERSATCSLYSRVEQPPAGSCRDSLVKFWHVKHLPLDQIVDFHLAPVSLKPTHRQPSWRCLNLPSLLSVILHAGKMSVRSEFHQYPGQTGH